MSNLLTIVIPSKNESTGIIDVIKLVLSQIDCQIIVADSSDNQQSIQVLKEFSYLHKNIKIVEGGLPSKARNNGAKLVSTPYILFLDADIYIFNPFLISDCLFTSLKGNYDLVTCKFKTDRPYRWVFRMFDIAQWFSSITKPFALGGFMLFKTETFNKLGGFNEEDKVAEDYRLSSKVKPKKFKVYNGYVYTSSRRFDKKGVWYMTKLMWNCWINHNNDQFFKQDQNYWK